MPYRKAPDSETREKEIQEIRRLYDSGLTIKQIARRIGRSPTTVYIWMDAAGIPRRGAPPDPSPRQLGKIRSLCESGATVTEIAAQLGCPASTVNVWMKAAGILGRVPSRKPGPPAVNFNPKQIKAMYDSGMSVSSIARAKGVAKSTAQKWVTEAGCTPRAQGGTKIPIDMPRALEMRAQGATLAEAAVKLGVTPRIVAARMKETGRAWAEPSKRTRKAPAERTPVKRTPTRTRKLPLSDAQALQNLRKQHESGMSLRKLSDRYHVSPSTIHNRLQAAKAPLRAGNGYH